MTSVREANRLYQSQEYRAILDDWSDKTCSFCRGPWNYDYVCETCSEKFCLLCHLRHNYTPRFSLHVINSARKRTGTKQNHKEMTSNVTAVLESKPTAATLLWVPHVAIAVSFLTFLAFNFYCYHMKYKQRYQRKSDESEIKARLKERRRILNIVKLRHMITPQIPASSSAFSKKNFKVTSDFKKASTLTAKMESTLTSKSSSNLQVLDCPFSVAGKPFDAISV